jgi:hypothetical protein
MNDWLAQRGHLLESYAFRLLLTGLIALMGGPTIGLDRLWGGAPFALIELSVIALALLILYRNRRLFWVALVLGIPTTWAIVLDPSTGLSMAGLSGPGLHAPFFCVVAAALAVRVVRSERADEETVVGSICAYLFIALAFASLFTTLEGWSPESFHFATPVRADRLFAELSYFSFVAITTLGYGDIVPVSALARALVSLESVVGILFPSIVIARVVSLYTSGGGRPFAAPDASRRPGRFQLLLGAEIVVLFAAAVVGRDLDTPTTLSLLTTLLLVAALYAGSDRMTTRALGIALATLALAGRWWPGPVSAARLEIAFAFETAFLALVAGSLLVWLIGEKRVTRDLLFAAISLYLLLGFVWASGFGLLELHYPGALASADAGPVHRSEIVYYSFMTLTTTGFGDISPVSAIAKRLANLESLVGILYPTVLVARLVSLYRSE